ncbi:pyridoxal-dependent decarboxylase, exosortase A system-associated [Parachitinimonas caeni]|uniref:Pyridoxal-dependent decarboxylase, exosortase A system-associated n=1 Tax=Parachitinimonas caeni TaxID=3031301 RepID=A0ABT7E0V3_9NEIS|nr:pyridoxal-dependent decarboxylase, exosortase A system-associated [Parachitinimonas caeni]MDK2125947.1 pyridoxal-dependent decarboxylase, exosortase A system-associated [Parachitinimonas caeni]
MNAPLHSPFTLAGDLDVNGQPLSRIVERLGQTPCYIYDRSLLDQRVATLRQGLDPRIQLHYAIKANPMPALVGHMARLVDGLDVASAGELKIALDAGMVPREISFAGPGKRAEELTQAVAAGVLINVESPRELPILAAASQKLGVPARVAVRVNPDFDLRASGMKMGGGAKQFGVDAEAVPALLREIHQLGLQFEGFHLFAGSQNLKADAIIDAQQKSYALALRLAAEIDQPLKVLNLGGGFGIPYFPGDQPLTVDPIKQNLNALAEQLATDAPGASVVIELGRYMVGEAGYYVCRVVDRKLSRGQVFLVTDGGMHHHLAASGNFGQVLRKNYPVSIIGGGPETEVASVVGPLCTPLDLLGDKMALPKAEPGALVVIHQSGAYGRSASPRDFLGHPEVVETLV